MGTRSNLALAGDSDGKGESHRVLCRRHQAVADPNAMWDPNAPPQAWTGELWQTIYQSGGCTGAVVFTAKYTRVSRHGNPSCWSGVADPNGAATPIYVQVSITGATATSDPSCTSGCGMCAGVNAGSMTITNAPDPRTPNQCLENTDGSSYRWTLESTASGSWMPAQEDPNAAVGRTQQPMILYRGCPLIGHVQEKECNSTQGAFYVVLDSKGHCDLGQGRSYKDIQDV